MADFTGTASDEIITPDFVSPTVTATGGKRPSNAADFIDAGGGNDVIESGGGNDVVIGGPGNDTAILGRGNDTFIWNPGDGSDVVEGGSGTDTLVFNGANVNETMTLSANGSRARLTRDVGNVVMDLNSMEHIDINARGGADNITIDDLTGSGVKRVAIDLSGTPGSGTGDGAPDTVTVNGTAGDDHITIANDGSGGVVVKGLAAQVSVTGAEPADRLVINGLGGNDTLTFNGSGHGAQISVVADGTDVAITQDGFSVVTEIVNVENLVINGTAGDDVIRASNGISALTNLTINGGGGNDTIFGGDGADLINAGDGNDIVDGGRGNDVALLGSGDDTFIWNPGDGSDIVEGQGGFDTLLFNGANVSEHVEISANGSRVRFTRDVANITMDLNSIERIDFNALGGADTITVDDLSGTGTRQVAIDLAATPGSGVGDGAADTVIVNGTAGDDHISVSTSGSSATVTGLAAQVSLTGAELADRLVINGLGGNDTLTFNVTPGGAAVEVFADGTNVGINQAGSSVVVDAQDIENVVINGTAGDDVIRASNGISALTNLTINGGAGNDTIFGGDGADLINAGDGNDIVDGGRGNDVALLGSGDDTFIWNPGDGSDVVEGQGGFDTMLFNGANVAEHVEISANGSRVRFTRDVANITMDLNSIERIDFNALGGADTITVDDLSGTGTRQVAIDLSSTSGSGIGDGAADTVIVNGTAGNDHIRVASNGSSVFVSGLAAQVTISGAEAANDKLVINAQDGNDRIDASALQAGQINLVLNGGSGNDTLIGSAGNDMLFGGLGADTFAFAGNFGHDTVGDFFAANGSGAHDFVQFDRSIFSDFADVLQHAQQIGNDTTITVDPNRSVTLQNVALNTLTAGDFRFG